MIPFLTAVPAAIYAAHKTYAATPAAAAVRALVPPANGTPSVVRVNRAGRYAAVLTRGYSMESSPVTSPVLVEKFSFGWQPLELLNFRCRLDAHAISAADRRTLMAGMPKMIDGDRMCAGYAHDDSGAPAEIETVRLSMSGPLVPYVAVAGSYAKGDWYGGGGGETLFHKNGTRWTYVAGGGGAMGESLLLEHHVPQSSMCALRAYDAKCP